MLTNTDPSLRDEAQKNIVSDMEKELSRSVRRSDLIPSPAEALTRERGQTHGRFSDHANYTQQLKAVCYRAYNERRDRKQDPLTPQQREALEMIMHKAGRILAGDASFADHWDDIAGYAHIANKEF